MKDKKHLYGYGSMGVIIALVGGLQAYQWFNKDYEPHNLAYAASQEVRDLKQIIELQAEYNRRLVEIQQQQIQQRYYEPPRYERPYYQPNYQQEREQYPYERRDYRVED